MRKRALLIGNTSGLPGVKVDILRFSTFLHSNVGGAWQSSEIDVLQDERKNVLLEKIDSLKRQSLDYLMILFSGHGGQHRQTILELNQHGECIEETILRGISTRQMNIYDCCRAFPQEITKSATDSLSARLFESGDFYRTQYENRIMAAIPQQALLYSCSIGQVSYDTPSGGVYLTNLLKAARTFSSDQKFKLIGLAHEEAVTPTFANSKKEKGGLQVPEAVLPKCLSSQQLIISQKA